MIDIAASAIPGLSVKAAGGLDVRPGGSTETGLRLGAADNILLAASYTPSENEHIKEIHLLLVKAGTITSGKVVSVSIQGDSSGDPDGTALGTSANVETDTIGSSARWIKFTFTNHVQLVANTAYHVVLTGDYTVSGTNYVAWVSDSVSSGGNQEIKDASWADVATQNFNCSALVWDLSAFALTEPVLWGGTEYPAIYDAPGSLIAIGEAEITTTDPSVEVRYSDVSSPAVNDVVKVRGVSYYAREIIPDSNGTFRAMLSQIAVPT